MNSPSDWKVEIDESLTILAHTFEETSVEEYERILEKVNVKKENLLKTNYINFKLYDRLVYLQKKGLEYKK